MSSYSLFAADPSGISIFCALSQDKMLILLEAVSAVKGGETLGNSVYDYCIQHDREELLRQWIPDRIAPQISRALNYGSREKPGGDVQRGTSGKPSSIPGQRAKRRAARSAPDKLCRHGGK